MIHFPAHLVDLKNKDETSDRRRNCENVARTSWRSRGIRERDRCAENGGNPGKKPREWIKFQKLILHSSVTLVKRQGRESMARDVSHGNPRNEKISSTPPREVKKRRGGGERPRGSSLRYESGLCQFERQTPSSESFFSRLEVPLPAKHAFQAQVRISPIV